MNVQKQGCCRTAREIESDLTRNFGARFLMKTNLAFRLPPNAWKNQKLAHGIGKFGIMAIRWGSESIGSVLPEGEGTAFAGLLGCAVTIGPLA